MDMISTAREFANACGLAESAQVELPFGQSWKESVEERFRPASALLYPRAEGLHIVAALYDDCIFNDATGFNQRTWETGDVLEIFIAPTGGATYWEMHVTPDNNKLQLRFEPESLVRVRSQQMTLEDCMIADPQFFTSQTHVDKESGIWKVYAFIPWGSIGMGNAQALYSIDLALCRYDADKREPKPILSSTAPLTRPSFHERREWDKLELTVAG